MRSLLRVFLLVIIVGMVSTACLIPFAPNVVRGSGKVVEEERDVSDFNKILVTGAGDVIVTQGSKESLTVETDDNLQEYIVTEVNGDTLEIGFKEGTILSSRGGRRVLEPSDSFVFRITVVDLEAISVSGAARLDIEKLKTTDLDLNLSGAGDIDIDDLNADSLDVVISGAGDVRAAGSVESQFVNLSGFGRYQAFDLESDAASVTISGAGGAEVWAQDSLKVTISGAGDVKYYGSPSVDPEISGVGRIQDMGEK